MVAADSFDEDLAAHYGAVVVPARPRKPRDQAAVEGAVLLAQRWILARRRDQTFFSLGALNAAIRVLLDELNDRPMKKLGISRRALYEQIDRPALQPLPATRYVLAQWKLCRLNIDYHVVVERHAYNKGDVQDARAIWTAVQQPGVKTVAVKSEEQQAVLALHRMRQQLVKFRTAQINGLRGLLAGYGEVMPRGRAGMQRDMPAVLERLSEQLPAMVVVETLREQWGRVGRTRRRGRRDRAAARGVAPEQPGQPAGCGNPRGRVAGRDRPGGDDGRSGGLSVRPQVRRLAGSGASPQRHGRTGAHAGHLKRGDTYLRTC